MNLRNLIVTQIDLRNALACARRDGVLDLVHFLELLDALLPDDDFLGRGWWLHIVGGKDWVDGNI